MGESAETIHINIEGTLPKGVMSKDIILRIIGDLRGDGSDLLRFGFTGSTVENMMRCHAV